MKTITNLQEKRNNVHALFILGYFNDDQYKLELDKIDNLELAAMFDKERSSKPTKN